MNIDTTKAILTQAEKEANDFQWYKEQMDRYIGMSTSKHSFSSGIDTYKSKKINYDLFNNIIDITEFNYVCKPFGDDVGELPANFVNRDIVSSKIKILLGLEMKRPFSWKVYAVNDEATTRKEQEQFKRIKDFVISQIMQPIKEQILQQHIQELQQENISEQDKLKIQQQIEEETQSMTPDEIMRYMEREHQDPAEALANQILQYILQKEDVKDKFNLGWKHALLSAEEIYWVGVVNGNPVIKAVNPLFFDCDRSQEYVEDGEWATNDMWMSPSEIVNFFAEDLTKKEIQELYENYNLNSTGNYINSEDFWWGIEDNSGKYRVTHVVFKALRKYGFVTFLDENQVPQLKIVDENYVLDYEMGDVAIEWKYIPEVHEGYRAGRDLYKRMRPLTNQLVDMENLYTQKLPYYGGFYDGTNSVPTAVMDRMRYFQYYYDIIIYRIEMLMASDKGKMMFINMGGIPRSMGVTLEQFNYMLASNKTGYINPNEEGNRGIDVSNMVKEVDMSLASDISRYIELAEYIERKCGESVGITLQMEGQISASEAVSNTRQSIQQSSHVLEPLFEYHNIIKRNVLTALLETCKFAYTYYPKNYLHYVLDDFSVQMLKVDSDLLANSIYGIFVANSGKAAETKQVIEQLAHAALQNQRADLSDVIKVLRSENLQETEELLELAEKRKQKDLENMQKQQQDSNEKIEQMRIADMDKQRAHELEVIVVKETERRETEIQKQAILSLGFSEDKDVDSDGIPDVLELAKHGLNADIQTRKLDLQEKKMIQDKKLAEEKLKIDRQKLNKPTGK